MEVYVLVKVVAYSESQVLGVYASKLAADAEAARKQKNVTAARYVVQPHVVK